MELTILKGLVVLLCLVIPLAIYFWPSRPLKIKEIWVYPIKSMKGIQLNECEIDDNGFKYDRIYMVAEPDHKANDGSYRFITQREEPRLILIRTAIDLDKKSIILEYPPENATVEIPLEIEQSILDSLPSVPSFIWNQTPLSYDIGAGLPEIKKFLCIVFADKPERASQMTMVAPQKRRTVERNAPTSGVLNRIPTSSFQDYYPGNLITTSSLNSLYGKVFERTKGEVQICQQNFRPNLVIESEKPWDEDTWKSVMIADKYVWHVACRNVRCQVTTVNLKRGQFEKSHEPYKTMQTFRRVDPGAPFHPCFGMNLVHGQVGYKLKVGDQLVVTSRGEHIYEVI